MQIGRQETEYTVSQVFIAFDIAKTRAAAELEAVLNDSIDDLHASIPSESGGRIRYPGEAKPIYTSLDDLPDGVFVQTGNGEALLIWQRHLHLWTPFGYSTTFPLTTPGPFTLLTPPSTVQVIRTGYKPVVG